MNSPCCQVLLLLTVRLASSFLNVNGLRLSPGELGSLNL